MRIARAAGWGLALLSAVAAQPAAADWRDTIKVFRVGMLVGDNPTYRIAQAEPFRRYLEDRLGVTVDLVPATALDGLIDGQADGRLDYAMHTASSFAATQAACACVEALVLPQTADGTTGYHAIAVARSDGRIRSIADAGGSRLAVGAADSIAGRLLPLALFAADKIPVGTHFSELVEEPDPESAVRAVLDGRADVALAWSSLAGDPELGYSRGVLTKMVADGSLAPAALRVVWQSPLVPAGPHAVRADLPADLKSELAKILIEMAELDPDAYAAIERSGGVRFVAAEPGMYDVMKVLVAPAGQ